jgi:hypothetical protein
VGAAERPADAGAAKPVDRLAIEALGSDCPRGENAVDWCTRRLRHRRATHRAISATSIPVDPATGAAGSDTPMSIR